jgi:protein phosphatase
LRVACCGRTAVGRVRSNNEDSLWLGRVGDGAARSGDGRGSGTLGWPGWILAVADGMGGALAGEVASRLAVETLASELARRAKEARTAPSHDELRDQGKAAIHAANARIRAEGETDASRQGMGTTLTAAWAVGRTLEVFQVGDSRAYLVRRGKMSQITKDQSLVGKLVEDGLLTEEQAEQVAGRHIILQALGGEEALDIVHDAVPLEPDDLVLLCTDGLSGMLKGAALESTLARGGPLRRSATRWSRRPRRRAGATTSRSSWRASPPDEKGTPGKARPGRARHAVSPARSRAPRDLPRFCRSRARLGRR